MKKSHILLSAWGVSILLILAMPQLRSLFRFGVNEIFNQGKHYDRMAITTANAQTDEEKFVAAIHATNSSNTSFSVSEHSNLAALYEYCKDHPTDVEAAAIYCRRAMRQPYPTKDSKKRNQSKQWIERSQKERSQLLGIAQIAEKQDPNNWLFRLAQAYVYRHEENNAEITRVLTKLPLPSSYSDAALQEAQRLERFYRGTFWGITPVQSVATKASIVFPNYAQISGLFDFELRPVPEQEKLAAAKFTVDMMASSEFYIASLVSRNVGQRLIGRKKAPSRQISDSETRQLLSKATWTSQLASETRAPFEKMLLMKPKFDFPEFDRSLLAATHAHIPLMTGLVIGALSLLAFIPWRPTFKPSLWQPAVIALAALPTSIILGGEHGYWNESTTFVSYFVDFNSAQQTLHTLINIAVACLAGAAITKTVMTWSDKPKRWDGIIAGVALFIGAFATPIQLSMIALGAMLATMDKDRNLHPIAPVSLLAIAFGLEYTLHPHQGQAYMLAAPALLMLMFSKRQRGITQLGWLGLGLIFTGFGLQRFTEPYLNNWVDYERHRLSELKQEVGLKRT